MNRAKSKPFYVIMKDNAVKIFSVHGPMADDAGLIDDVCAAQQRGRDVTLDSDPDLSVLERNMR